MPRTTDNPRTARVTLRIPPQLKAEMKAHSAKLGKSLTDWLCSLAQTDMERYECATCGVMVTDSEPHEHAATWQGSSPE